MVLIGLTGLDLSLLKGWVEHRFGFLGLLLWVLLGLGIAIFFTWGKVRRFFVGALATGSVFWVLVIFAPVTILGWTWDRLIEPVASQVFPSNRGNLRILGYQIQRTMIVDDLRIQRVGLPVWIQSRIQICQGFPEVQSLLLIPPSLLAILGGLIALGFPRRPVDHTIESAGISRGLP